MPSRNDAEAIFGQLFLTPEGRSNGEHSMLNTTGAETHRRYGSDARG